MHCSGIYINEQSNKHIFLHKYCAGMKWVCVCVWDGRGWRGRDGRKVMFPHVWGPDTFSISL